MRCLEPFNAIDITAVMLGGNFLKIFPGNFLFDTWYVKESSAGDENKVREIASEGQIFSLWQYETRVVQGG